MTDITNLQQNKYLQCASHNLVTSVESVDVKAPSFLAVTNKFDFSSLKGIEYDEKVLNGSVSDEIASVQGETDMINSIVANNTVTVTFDSNAAFAPKQLSSAPAPIEAPVDSTKKLKTKTDTTKLMSNVQYSNRFNEDLQKKIIEKGVETLINWLDDYINNYDERVAEGKTRGDSEVKLSFLLRLRKSIENCDFPIGFGNDEYFAQASGDGYVVLGAYSSSYNTAYYLNPKDHANDNVGAFNHFNRNILLNAEVFCINRTYTSEEQVRNAINNGAFDYLRAQGTTSEQINEAYNSVLFASDDYYYNFAAAYFASIMAHEFIHSTHITNEAVTYNTCEMVEDDFRYKPVFDGWAPETQAAVDTLFQDVNLNGLTYGVSGLPTAGGGALGFHELSSVDSVVKHGHEENMSYDDTLYSDGTIAYKGYKNFNTGNTEWDDKKELMNFIV